jgi:hypothetical protein
MVPRFLKDYSAFIDKWKRNGDILGRERNVDKSVHRTATIKNGSARIRLWIVSIIRGLSKIFLTGAAICTAVVVARSTDRW